MESEPTHVWELDLGADVVDVLIPFRDLGLVCRQVRADETERSGVKKKSYNHTPFVPGFPRHSCLHRRHGHIPAGGEMRLPWLLSWRLALPT